MRLENKTVFITGAGQGDGELTAKRWPKARRMSAPT